MLGTAHAAQSVGDLSPALMRGSQAPRGFASDNYKVFSAYSASMAVAGQTCAAGSIPRSDWKQGLHQVLKRPVPPTILFDVLEVCGYLFTTDTPSIGYYQSTLARARTSEKKGTTRALQISRVGDAAFAAYAPPQKGAGIYISVFRYRNALIGVTYLYHYTPIQTTTAFVRMIEAMGKRLERSH
jgi:hypothetical protein